MRQRQYRTPTLPEPLVWESSVPASLRRCLDAGPSMAPAVFLGWQEVPNGPPLALWNLTAPIPGYSVHSTVVSATLRAAGYRVEDPAPGLLRDDGATLPRKHGGGVRP
jgi:hypothetical protein